MRNPIYRTVCIGLVLVSLLVVSSQQLSGAQDEALSINSAAPTAVGLELIGQLGGATFGVAVQDDYAYIGIGPRLVVLDVSQPVTLTGRADCCDAQHREGNGSRKLRLRR